MPEDAKEVVRERTDLAALVRTYGVELVEKGGRLWACCPFHQEKTPSFSVDPAKGMWYCFGQCHEGGDVFSFVERKEGLGFRDALRLLAEKAGVPLGERDRDRGAPGSGGGGKAELFAACDLAARFYESILAHAEIGRRGRDYVARRGIDERSAREFRIGLAQPGARDALLRAAHRAGLSVEALHGAGLARRDKDGSGWHDFFFGRLMFPILAPGKRVVGFGGRTLDGSEPKYLNTSETPLFHKRDLLYGLEQARGEARHARRLSVVEGYTDVILCHQVGFKTAVATLGTALLVEHARAIAALVPEVLLVFDGDAAGEKASDQSLQVLLEAGLDVRVAVLPDGLDPADVIVQRGRDAFAACVASATEWLPYAAERFARTLGSGTVGRARAVEELARLVAGVPDQLRRDAYVRAIAERLGFPERDVRVRLAEIQRERRTGPHRGAEPPRAGSREAAAAGRGSAPEASRTGLRLVERAIVAAVLARPDLARDLSAELRDPALLTDVDLRAVLDEALDLIARKGTADVVRVLDRFRGDEARCRVIGEMHRWNEERGPAYAHEPELREGLSKLKRRARSEDRERLKAELLSARERGDLEAARRLEETLRFSEPAPESSSSSPPPPPGGPPAVGPEAATRR